MSRAVLSLGSNQGDRYAYLQLAVKVLGESVVLVSGVYETPPWGDVEQPAYLNAVALVVDPEAAPADWLDRAHACETAAGRARDPERRFGPRTLDVDVIDVRADDGSVVVQNDPDLTLPHPRAHLRAFVLRPWLEIQPYAELTGHGRLLDLVRTGPAAADLAGLRARDDISLET